MIQGFMLLKLISPRKDTDQLKSSTLKKKGCNIISHVHSLNDIIETGCNPEQGLSDSMVAKNK